RCASVKACGSPLLIHGSRSKNEILVAETCGNTISPIHFKPPSSSLHSAPILFGFAFDRWCCRVLALDPVPRAAGAIGRAQATSIRCLQRTVLSHRMSTRLILLIVLGFLRALLLRWLMLDWLLGSITLPVG